MSSPERIEYLDYREGLKRVDAFVAGEAKLEELNPFILPANKRSSKSGSPVLAYYLGVKTGSQRYLQLPVNELGLNGLGESIYVLPNSLTTVGGRTYYWLNFFAYPILKPEDLESTNPLISCRLKPDDPRSKIDFQSWHGIGEQLLADYLTLGPDEIRFPELLPFTLQVKNKSQLNYYKLAGNPQFQLSLSENRNIQDGDILKFIPTEDNQRVYQWLDILKIIASTPQERWPLVSSYRIDPEAKSLYSTGWFGLERQLLLDYALSDPRIKYEHLKPIRTRATAGGTIVTILSSRSNKFSAVFDLPIGLLSDTEETISIPCQDEQGRYQWLELHRYNSGADQPEGKLLASALITRKGISQREWLGIERQLLRDFTERKVSFEDLKPLQFQVGQRQDMLHLWKENGKKVYVVLSKYFELKSGDNLEFSPEQETEEGATFLLFRGGKVLARYAYIKDQNKFVIQDNIAFNGDLLFKYSKEDDIYIDPNNNEWVGRQYIVDSLRISNDLLNELLGELHSVQYLGPADKPINLFRRQDVLIIAERKGIHRLDGWEDREYSFLYPGTNLSTFRDDEGDWVAESSLLIRVRGLSKRFLDQILVKVRSKTVRSVSGKNILAYNLEHLLSFSEVKERLELPKVDKKTGLFSDSSGRWGTIETAVQLLSISRRTLEEKFLGKVSSKAGMGRIGITTLYNLDELEQLKEFQDYAAKPQVDIASGIYQDKENHRYAALDFIARELEVPRYLLEKIIPIVGIAGLPGKSRSGKEVILFNLQEISQALQDYLKKDVVTTLPEEANEYLRRLAFGESEEI